MNSPLSLRLMTRADLAFADALRSLAAWNQTLDDWDRLLVMEPEGCFVAEWNGAPAGTATTTIYGAELAWIGMVLVHPEYQRRGIGRALLEHCVEHLRSRRVRCFKLDATPLGKKIYDRLGFKQEWTLTRWIKTDAPARPSPADRTIRSGDKVNCPALDRLDAEAFGVSRSILLRALSLQSHCVLVRESESGRISSYGMLRTGSHALYLGPVVAARPAAGLSLLEALVARASGQSVLWDLPDQIAPAVAWARSQRFVPQRSLIRMYLGQNLAPGNPRKQLAVAGPEIG